MTSSIDAMQLPKTSDSDLLSPEDVARRLGVCTKTATRIMKELPHVCVSLGISSRKKRIRITERTLNDFKEGRIERSSIENDEEGSNDDSK